MSGAGGHALTKSINLECFAVFLPASAGGWGLGVSCSRAQLPYAINRRSFHRYGPRNEEISVAPVKKSSALSFSLSLSHYPSPSLFLCRVRWLSSFSRRATFCPVKTVWINISAHLKVQWASGPCLSAFRLLCTWPIFQAILVCLGWTWFWLSREVSDEMHYHCLGERGSWLGLFIVVVRRIIRLWCILKKLVWHNVRSVARQVYFCWFLDCDI